MSNVTRCAVAVKPAKPYPDFPLFPHGNGQWAKKVKGRLHYFGPWANWQAALAEYEYQAPWLHTGREPPPPGAADAVTIGDLRDAFTDAKQQMVDAGELAERTLAEYKSSCSGLVDFFGKSTSVKSLRPVDFDAYRATLARSLGPTALGNEIQRTRTIFKYGFDAELLQAPVRFGPNFRKPSRRIMRAAKNAAGSRMWEADELRKILDRAKSQMRAMILLGIQAGFEPEDCRQLPLEAVVHVATANGTAWVDYPRPKTHVRRRFPLWPETAEALAAVLEKRKPPKSKAAKHLAFVTKQGNPWGDGFVSRPISQAFRRICRAADVYRPNVGFLGLRHAFETIGGDTKDQVAVDAIMGHVDGTMAGVYRERVDDHRLQAVTDCVHDWMFEPESAPDILPFRQSS